MKWYEKKQVNGMRVTIVIDKKVLTDYLKNTDWYITRNSERGIDVPQDVLEKRQFCRDNLKENNNEVDDVKNLLQYLCDKKSQEAKNYIAGKKVTDEQLARYVEKFDIATEYKENGNYANTLQLEADFQNMSVDELADLIINKGKEYKQALIGFNAKIEAFRVAVEKMIDDGEIDKANEIIETAKEFGIDTTDEDIKNLINGTS